MGILALLLVLLLSLFSVRSVDEGVESQQCTLSVDGAQRCGPTRVNGAYQLPASGTVIRAVVNNGPLPPEYQEGYQVTIDADGTATIVVTPVGASEGLGDQRTSQSRTTTVALGAGGLQQLLAALDGAGFFFFLPTRDEVAGDVPVGGDVSNLEVTLADGAWDIEGAGLQGDDRATLDAAQRILAEAVGLDPDNPTADLGATPPAR